MKKIINAVRVFCIEDNKILCIKYINDKNNGYYDLPGGKIKENESILDAAKREVKEETGINISELSSKGKIESIYQDMTFIYNIVFAKKFEGTLLYNEDNECMWIDINELINQKKKMTITKLLEEQYLNDLENKNISYKLHCDQNHNIIKIEAKGRR